MFSQNDKGERLAFKPAYSDKEEAIIVCNDIKRIKREEHGGYSDFAILYRTNAQSRSFEEVFRKENIPYRIYGGLSFYQRKEIKDIIAYFRVVANPDDEEALKRIINYPARGIGDTTVGKIAACAMSNSTSLWNVISHPVQYQLDVNKGTQTKLQHFCEMISTFIEKMDHTDAYELGSEIIKVSGISADLYGDTSPEALARQENLEEFLSGMQDFVQGRKEEGMEEEISLTDFLQEVSLMTDLDSDDDSGNAQRVTLMTVHSAKGLEFPTVFVVGLEENIFPSPLSTTSKRELEEERRLLYVAITRAERHCILTCAKNRWRYGKMEFDTPSRFLYDIDPNLMKVEEEKGADTFTARTFNPSPRIRTAEPRFRQTTTVPNGNLRRLSEVTRPSASTSTSATSKPMLQEGNTIEHERFGVGTVIKVEGTGENTKATVQFRHAGTKQLLLKFAKYKVIG